MGDLAAAGLHQVGNRQVVALDGLDRRLRQQRKLHGLDRGRWRTAPFRALGVPLDQPVPLQAGQHAVHGIRHLTLAPAQEQLGSDVRIDAPDEPLHVLGPHHRVADESARHERRQGEQMQDVVAVVRGEDRGLIAHPHDVPEGMRLAG